VLGNGKLGGLQDGAAVKPPLPTLQPQIPPAPQPHRCGHRLGAQLDPALHGGVQRQERGPRGSISPLSFHPCWGGTAPPAPSIPRERARAGPRSSHPGRAASPGLPLSPALPHPHSPSPGEVGDRLPLPLPRQPQAGRAPHPRSPPPRGGPSASRPRSSPVPGTHRW